MEAYIANVYPNYAYHNLEHAHDVAASGEDIAQRCRQAGIEVDVYKLRIAALLHDIFIHLDYKLFNQPSAEHLAAGESFSLLIRLNVREDWARDVSNIILATNPNIPAETLEQKAIKAADLYKVGGPVEDFLTGSFRLHHERFQHTGEISSLKSSFKRSMNYLNLFLRTMVELTPAARDDRGRSIFHTQAIGNILSFAQVLRDKNDKLIVVVENLIDPLPKETFQRESQIFYIGFSPDENIRESALKLVRSKIEEDGSLQYGFCIPGSPSAIPLPDAICDEVITTVHSDSALEESSRILKPGGMLRYFQKKY